ncbi:MAG TPA: isoaspartyl peptidase/L-asparaginase family protein, partial [Burkholderiales bacterium]|nr:isoaspartyl peptidase/L-asparaginase family protein [Burkholderiales bacterium]
MYAIIVHGGAGEWKTQQEQAALRGVRRAVEAGAKLLAQGKSALDAVTAAVVSLEDNPVFNAGTGSVLNLLGRAEMDASVMVSEGRRAGGVACLSRVKNPVRVARKVMEKTDHILLADRGAVDFARIMGFADYDPVTVEQRRIWQKKSSALSAAKSKSRVRDLMKRYAKFARGTVGAVALDQRGHFAAATSSGGLTLKLPGRVGDTPLPGAGNYATPLGAASATGLGEVAMRYLVTKSVCDLLARGKNAQEAVDEVLLLVAAEPGAHLGIVAIDRDGNVGAGHHSQALMPHACRVSGGSRAVVKMQVEP